MPRRCSVCRHPDLRVIDHELVAGLPHRGIASRHGLTRSAVFRHRREHLPPALLRASEAAEIAAADNLMDELQAMLTRGRAYECASVSRGDMRSAIAALREQRALIELLSKLMPDGLRPDVDVVYTTEWG